jgi:hypothetical protein
MAAPNIPSQTLPANVADLDSWVIGNGKFVWVMKMEPTDLAGSTATLYASTDTYRAKASPPRLVLPSMSISVLNDSFGLTTTDGRVDLNQFRAGQLAYGGFEIINTDGQYDSWVTSYGWSDAKCTLLFGQDGSTLREFLTVKVVAEPEYDIDVIRFRVKGAEINPNGQIITDTFDGDGTPSANQLEGRSYHEGMTVPALVGKVDNIAPILIDPDNLTYLIDHTGDGIDALATVYEGGYDLETDPSPVAFTATLATGSFDLEASPTWRITCDATGAARHGAGDYTLATNFRTLVEDFGGGATPTTAGLGEDGGFYIEAGANARFEDFLHYSIQPLGFYWTAQDGAKLYAGEIGNPADGTSVKTLTDAHIKSIDRQQTAPPAWEVRVGYRPLHVTLSDFAGVLSDDMDEMARLSTPSRHVRANDSSVLTNYPNALSIQAESSLYDEADASTLASELLAIYKVKRDILRVELVRHPMCAWIGQIVEIKFPRYGLTNGKKYMVTGWEIDLNSRRFVLECWG